MTGAFSRRTFEYKTINVEPAPFPFDMIPEFPPFYLRSLLYANNPAKFFAKP